MLYRTITNLYAEVTQQYRSLKVSSELNLPINKNLRFSSYGRTRPQRVTPPHPNRHSLPLL